jgi:hypothetical protein
LPLFLLSFSSFCVLWCLTKVFDRQGGGRVCYGGLGESRAGG